MQFDATERLCIADGGAIAVVASGLPFTAAGDLVVDSSGPIATYQNGLPFTAEGRICVEDASAVGRSSGMWPVAASGRIAVSGLSWWDSRLFFSEREFAAAPGSSKTLATQAVLQALGWSMSGGSNATRVNSAGNVELANGNFITHERGATHCLTQWTSSLAQVFPALVTTAGQFKSPDGLATLQLATSPVSYFNLSVGFTALSNTCTMVAYIKRGNFDYYANSEYGFYNSATSQGIGYAAPNYSTGKIEEIQSLAGTITARTEPMGNGVFKLIVTATGGMSPGDWCFVYAGATGGIVGAGRQHWTSGCHVNDGPLPLPFLNTFDTHPLFSAGTPMRQNLVANSTAPVRDPYSYPFSLDAATGYTKVEATTVGYYHSGPLTSPRTAGCVYTMLFAALAKTSDSLSLFCVNPNTVGFNTKIISGPGVLSGNIGNPRIDGLSASVPTVVAFAFNGNAVPVIYPKGGGISAVGDSILIPWISVFEGTADLPYTPTTGTPISEYPQAGIQVAEQRTRETLHPRDLTQAAWVKTNVTAAKTAIGLDGAANSCTTLTATATNGTCLQAVTSSSANRAGSAYIRSRSASTLTIDMTCDGGTTWQAVTVNAAFTRSSITQSSVTNPSYGFRLRASGDSIDVDFVQGEIGSFATPPIWGTESAAQARDVTQVTLPVSAINDTAQTTAVTCVPDAVATGIAQGLLTRSAGSYGWVVYLDGASSAAKIWDGLNVAQTGNNATARVPITIATRYSAAGIGISMQGGTVASASFDGSMGVSGSSVGLGGDVNTYNPFTGLITSLQIAAKAANDAQLQLASLGQLP